MNIAMSSSGGAHVVAAVFFADFVSGFVHWAEDAYARFKPSRKVALINKVALDNELHHRRPRDFLARSWWESSWDLAMIGACVIAIAVATHHLSCAIVVFVVLTVNANQMHKWTHRNPRENPWWVTWLQRIYVLQTPRHHGRHHHGEKNSHYCVVTNFLNPMLEEVSFWRRLERGVDRLFGRAASRRHS